MRVPLYSVTPNNLLSDKDVAISNIAGYYAGYYDKGSLQDNWPFEAERSVCLPKDLANISRTETESSGGLIHTALTSSGAVRD
jgi:hypothetical protein